METSKPVKGAKVGRAAKRKKQSPISIETELVSRRRDRLPCCYQVQLISIREISE
jgi:hypothetical protein